MTKILTDNWQKSPKEALRDGFGEAVLRLGRQRSELVVLTADLASSTRVDQFRKKYPDRFFQLGVAEQNLVAVAAGLSLRGKVPFCCSFATFLTGRAWEQIRVCLAANKLGVKLVGSHAGLSHPADGFTAQASEDLSLMACLPAMTVVYPADFNQIEQAVPAVYQQPGPVYLRMTREPTPVFIKPQAEFKLGQAQILKQGKDITVISAGPILYQILLAAEKAEKRGISAQVVNLHTLKPIDEKTIINSVKETGRLLTVEDHQLANGLGAMVGTVVSQNHPVPVKMIGLSRFGRTSRNYSKLLRAYGLDQQSIYKEIVKLVEKYG